MGRVIVSKSDLSITPYYLPQIGINIYSLEELCYFYYQNSYLLDKECMCEDLVKWIEEEFDYGDLTKVLRNMLKNDSSFVDFIAAIMRFTALYSEEVQNGMILSIRENAKLDRNEKRKRRADYLTKQGLYTAAINEYESIIRMNDKKDYVLTSAIYHNIGYCYAQMFMFRCAAEYYEKAYKINGRSTCLMQYMMAMKLTLSEQEYKEMVLRNMETVSAEPELEICLKEAEDDWLNSDMYKELTEMEEIGSNNRTQEYYDKQEKFVNELRETFRKSENELI